MELCLKTKKDMAHKLEEEYKEMKYVSGTKT